MPSKARCCARVEGSVCGKRARLDHVGSFDYVDTKTFLSAIDSVLPTYQPLFQKYATAFDWRLLAAIAYQESHWNPLATSPTGVRGLMMLTRATADGLGVNDRLDPEESIQGGALYLQRLMAKIPATVPEDERIWFALAAYNIGWGHMLDARKLTKMQSGNPDSWVDVKQRLPMLSQKRYYPQLTYGYARGREAYNYVENIRRYQVSLVGYLQEKEKKAEQERQTQAAMKQFDILASSSGFFGSVSVTYFFWQLLTHKRIRLSRTEFLGDEPYNFIASFKKKDTQWIKRYFYLFITWFGLVCLGGILIYLPDWLQLR